MYARCIIVTFLIAYCRVNATDTLAYNCEGEQIKITRISANEVEICEREKRNVYKRHVNVQVIQTKKMEIIQISHCLIERTAIIMHCGHLSHSSIVQSGLSATLVQTSAQECTDIHKNLQFRYKGNLLYDLKPNSTKDFSVTEAGSVDATGSCMGTNIVQNGVTYPNAVMIANVKITIEDYITTIDTIRKSIILDNGSTCDARGNTCFTAKKGTSVWQYNPNSECAKTSRDVLYEGPAVITSTERRNGTQLTIGEMLMVESHQKMITLEIIGATHLCFQMVYTTDVERIMIITKNPVYGFYFEKNEKIIPQNIDLALYMNMKMYFLASEVKENLEELYNDVKFATCENKRDNMLTRLRIARQSEMTYAHLLTDEKGYITVQQGDCLLSIKCEPVIVQIRETNKCYKHLPIMFNNRSMFMEPNGRTITKVSAEIPCTRIASVLFQIEDNVWISMNPQFSFAQPPKKLKPQAENTNMDFGNIKRYLLAGVYSTSQLESFNEYIRHPMRMRQANEYITTRMVNTKQIEQTNDFRFTNLLSPEEIKKMKNEFLTDVEQRILKFGSVMGAITGVILLIQIIRYIISTVVNFNFLKSTLGCGFHLIFATFTSITNLLVRNNVRKSEKDNEQQTHEAIENEDNGNLYPRVQVEARVDSEQRV